MTPKPTQRVIGRGERVLPGVWRLRLPLPWPGVPHCNAWAIAAGNGVVLVDTGMHGPGSMAHLERAMEQVGLRVEHVRLVVCTHAHSDHCGEAATIAERAGCEVWMHPNSAHLFEQVDDPESVLARRLEIARQSGLPEQALARLAADATGPSVKMPLRVDRDLVPGVVVETDLGPWSVIETPGHAPSHVCLHQPDRRLLLSGDHLLGRVSLVFEPGWAQDPVGDFLESLDRIEPLDARLALPGHGRPFTDLAGHIQANRARVRQRLDAVRRVLAEHGPITAFDAAPLVYGEELTEVRARWLLTKLIAYLRHLERRGEARRIAGDPERWVA